MGNDVREKEQQFPFEVNTTPHFQLKVKVVGILAVFSAGQPW